MVHLLSVLIILFALTIVQNTLIVCEIRLRLQARIQLVSQILSSIIAIYVAFKGWGVLAIVWKTLLNQIFTNIRLWIQNNWMPSLEFSKNSFKKLFLFSSKFLLTRLFDTTYQQIYRLIVGKFFPAADLGYYTRAEQFKNLLSNTISGVLLSFLLPVFSNSSYYIGLCISSPYENGRIFRIKKYCC